MPDQIGQSGAAQRLDRRTFLKGSAAGVAAALGIGLIASVPAAAQQQAPQPAPPKKDEPGKSEPAKPKPLVDDQGREYRVCDMCGGNMYKQEDTWTCEQCGYSYVE